MIGVIQNRVKVLSSTADLALRRVGQVVWIAVGAVVNRVLDTLQGLTTQEIIQGAILHLQNDHILDEGLKVIDRRA